LKDENKTKKQLIDELARMRQQLAELRKAETGCKKAEEKIKEEKEFILSLLLRLKEGFAAIDHKGKQILVNDELCKMTGYSKEELLNQKPPFKYWAEEGIRDINKAFKKTLKGTEGEYELIFKRKNGERFIALVSPRKIIDLDGNTVFFATVKDVTERKQAEKALQASYRKLKDAQQQLIQAGKMAAIGQLAAGISHELNQPLTGIKGFAQAVLMELNEESPLEKDLRKIIEQADKMDRIIKNIRLFARKSEFKMQQLDINQPLKDSLMLLNEQLRVHNIQLDTSLCKNLPKIRGDHNQLEQAFINLITNARDAIDSLKSSRGGKLIIKTSLNKDKKNIEIIFKDTGCGISKEKLEHIFNPFYTTKSPNGGIGLGLSILYRIIEDHKGRIDVKSRLGKGTTFKITLPVS